MKLLNFEKMTEEHRKLILDYISKIIDAINYYVNNHINFENNLKLAITHLIGKGKLLRPLLSLIISRGLNVNFDKALKLAVAAELGHTASLIHDDIIDKSNFRRGVLAVHVLYGNELAIIAGDVLILLSNQLVSELGKDVMNEVLTAGIKMCRGEALELGNNVVSLEDYLNIVYLKTASFFEHIARSNALLARLNYNYVQLFGDFGKELGYAFQFRDDVLDIIGDELLIGKPVRHDSNVNKPNLINILCEQRNLTISEALKIANNMINEKINNALSILRYLPLHKSSKDLLSYILNVMRSRYI